MHTLRTGSGRPLFLVPGVGADTGTWSPVLARLQAQREIVGLDLPGFGQTAMLPGDYSLAAVADPLEAHLHREDLVEAELVGSSMGARLVLELAHRGVGRCVVALDPGGFWSPTQKTVFGATLTVSVALIRTLRPALPTLLVSPIGRTALLAQLSARPWALDRDYAVREVQGLADALGSSPRTGLPPAPSRTGAGRVGRPRPSHAAQPGQIAETALPRRRGRSVEGVWPLPALGPARPRGRDRPAPHRVAGQSAHLQGLPARAPGRVTSTDLPVAEASKRTRKPGPKDSASDTTEPRALRHERMFLGTAYDRLSLSGQTRPAVKAARDWVAGDAAEARGLGVGSVSESSRRSSGPTVVSPQPCPAPGSASTSRQE